ncbi:GlsB/YeaQ/YmgE family stress response membrane protein [Gordonia iterans]|uniref:GlsB/YeaQ/YmgE family stress response membrane protein n=1 Tax=Gordonia iterans TaxID=1004901 RepID=A0A2S0KIH0_9ACTN|nr:GlsB/YeaQ/YmgE family stress response membrane protein [Gordonia iterans]AVM01441.1 GlsB/YeaQ/YmgE family stress response membrane protein [Gordonia iterans]
MLDLSFLGWILIGGLAGWAGSKMIKGSSLGVFLNIVVGVIGGLVGGFVLNLLGFNVDEGGWIFSFFTALLGAVILLWLAGLVSKKQDA